MCIEVTVTLQFFELSKAGLFFCLNIFWAKALWAWIIYVHLRFPYRPEDIFHLEKNNTI